VAKPTAIGTIEPPIYFLGFFT